MVPVANVVFPSANVTVREAVNVVGVRVTPKLEVPPALPARITESCVVAALAVTDPNTSSFDTGLAVPIPTLPELVAKAVFPLTVRLLKVPTLVTLG